MVHQLQIAGEQLIPLDDGALVASRSQPGAWHVVRAGRCDCAGFQYRQRCRHVAAVAAAEQQRYRDADYWYRMNVEA